MSFESVQIGDCTLYLGDCLEVLPTLSGVDAVVTDPPYGIGFDRENVSMSAGLRVDGSQRQHKTWAGRKAKGYDTLDWDVKPDKAVFDAILNAADAHIIWGGNYFELPLSGGWLIWDKCVSMPSLSKCELAWTSFMGHTEIIHHVWAGYRKERPEERFHPTQKPLDVMTWCIRHLPSDAATILDPFMGSGTTGVACVKMGRKFIGIEKERKYFDIACERIRNAELPLLKAAVA